jgi:hypothetical protein
MPSYDICEPTERLDPVMLNVVKHLCRNSVQSLWIGEIPLKNQGNGMTLAEKTSATLIDSPS